MKTILKFSIALLAIIPVTQALAADLMTLPPPPAEQLPPPPVLQLRPTTYDWSGIYAGAFAGASCINGTLIDNNTTTSFANTGCGYKGGGLFGYNRQFGQIVVGAEIDAGIVSTLVDNQSPGANYTMGLDYVGTARLRAGWAMNENLFFLTGGGTYGQAFVTDPVAGKMTANPYGYVLGGGIEHAATDHMRLRLEYLYTHMMDSHYSCPACNVDVKWGDQHEVRAAAIWAF